MAFQPVPNVLKAAVVFNVGGTRRAVNTFYREFTTGYLQADVDDTAAVIDAVIASEWLPILPVPVVYVGTEVKGLAVENDLFAFDDAGAGAGAIADTEYASPQVSFAIKRLSNNTGRSARGRIFWPRFASNQLVGAGNTLVTEAVRLIIVAAVDDIRVACNGGDGDAVIVSRFTNGAARTNGITFPWISTAVTNDTVDTQRRRLRSNIT